MSEVETPVAGETATRTRRPLDELDCMRKIDQMINEQPVSARRRIMEWCSSKFERDLWDKPTPLTMETVLRAFGTLNPPPLDDNHTNGNGIVS